jgi:hypothetical protein
MAKGLVCGPCSKGSKEQSAGTTLKGPYANTAHDMEEISIIILDRSKGLDRFGGLYLDHAAMVCPNAV